MSQEFFPNTFVVLIYLYTLKYLKMQVVSCFSLSICSVGKPPPHKGLALHFASLLLLCAYTNASFGFIFVMDCVISSMRGLLSTSFGAVQSLTLVFSYFSSALVFMYYSLFPLYTVSHGKSTFYRFFLNFKLLHSHVTKYSQYYMCTKLQVTTWKNQSSSNKNCYLVVFLPVSVSWF